ncbi:UDP-2,3-diacylglucosamine diphosphatase [Rhodohalobacter halophilus]|uniref:UDP-2,3-diacylglucosamine diphosphatase n=1 Tax=Rhodohalobacter halophilus TaxID=1812810 RepID=UPI00083F6395|nr:metallophosphoesterase [Rhodohalobacter halophilus]
MTHLFLSDVHLGAFTPEVNRELELQLISLVEYCSENSIQVHILGDLFDYWMEFGAIKPKLGESLLESLKHYNHHVKPATYITGNHDNWTEGYFSSAGFDLIEEYKVIEADTNKLFIHHGDGLKDSRFNLPRPLFHRLLRHPLFVRFYKFIFSPETGIDIMKQFSAFSRNNPSDDPKRLNSWATSFLKETDYRYVISGHDHHARVETFPFGTYINLGTFYGDKTVAIYTNGECNLVRWDAENRTFTPFKSDYKDQQ